MEERDETRLGLHMHNLTDSNHTQYVYPFITLMLSITSSSLSIFGASFILISYCMLKEIRNFTRKLVVSLTVADVVTAVGISVSVIRYLNLNEDYVKNYGIEDALCTIQSFMTTLSSLVSFFLTSIIAIYICDTVINQTDRLDTNKWLLIFNLISWLIPGCIVTVALVMDVLGGDPTPSGATGPWCWISETADNGVLWGFVSGKGWEIACYLITTVIYLSLIMYRYRRYRKRGFHDIQCSLRDEDKNFLYVWLVLYVLRVWGTLKFLLRFRLHPSGEEDYMYALLYLQALGDPAQAFCNFLLFCVFDKMVRTKMIQKMKRCKTTIEEAEDEEDIRLLGSGSKCDDHYGTGYIQTKAV